MKNIEYYDPDWEAEVMVKILSKRISAAITLLEKTKTISGLPKGHYDPDAHEALFILKGEKDIELNQI
jgi:hypothetical protein